MKELFNCSVFEMRVFGLFAFSFHGGPFSKMTI